MQLRAFVPADAPVLTDLLHRAYAELGEQGLNFTAVNQTEATTLVRASAGASWVILDGDVPVATMTISWPPSTAIRALTREAGVPGRAWLNQLAVDPSRRGCGLAPRLRDVGYAWCTAAGATSIGLDTAVPATDLIDLYTAWGLLLPTPFTCPARPTAAS